MNKYALTLCTMLFTSSLCSMQMTRVTDRKDSKTKPKGTYERVNSKAPSVWEWQQFFARTNVNYIHNTEKSVEDDWWVETVQPLYVFPRSYSDTLFMQFRAMFDKSDQTYDTGLGYRALLDDDRYLLGLNGFFDVQTPHDLLRLSLGADFLTEWFNIWGNLYKGQQGWIEVSKVGTTTTDWRVLNGGDINASAPLPYFPWLRFEAGYYHWSGVDAVKDVNGYQVALAAQLAGPLSIQGGRMADNYIKNNYVCLTLNLGSPNFAQYTLYNTPVAKSALPARTLKRFILNPIKRLNNMRYQTRTVNGSSANSISIKRA